MEQMIASVDSIDYERGVVAVKLPDDADPKSFQIGGGIAVQQFGGTVSADIAEDGSHVKVRFGVHPEDRAQVALDVITKGVMSLFVSGEPENAAEVFERIARDIRVAGAQQGGDSPAPVEGHDE